MANDNKPRGGRVKPRSAAERPFDTWLQKQLHAMYDEIASEPLPSELLNLIDSDAAADRKTRSGRDPSNDKK